MNFGGQCLTVSWFELVIFRSKRWGLTNGPLRAECSTKNGWFIRVQLGSSRSRYDYHCMNKSNLWGFRAVNLLRHELLRCALREIVQTVDSSRRCFRKFENGCKQGRCLKRPRNSWEKAAMVCSKRINTRQVRSKRQSEITFLFRENEMKKH